MVETRPCGSIIRIDRVRVLRDPEHSPETLATSYVIVRGDIAWSVSPGALSSYRDARS